MRKLAWLLCLTVVLGLFAGCQPDDVSGTAGVTVQQTEPVDTQGVLPKEPGSSLCDYDPDRELYISGENVYLDYYINISGISSFDLHMFSRSPLMTEDISVTFPVDLPFAVEVSSESIERRTTGSVSSVPAVSIKDTQLPYYVYQASQGVAFTTAEDRGLYSDYMKLEESDFPEFYVYVINIALHDIKDVQETVELETVDITAGKQTYTVKLGGVRILPESEFPRAGTITQQTSTQGSYFKLYNDGLVQLHNVCEMNDLNERFTLTGLHIVGSEAEILDIQVTEVYGSQSFTSVWDGESKIRIAEADKVSISLILRDHRVAGLCADVSFHICLEYTDEQGQEFCRVDVRSNYDVGNYHELYAIIFDGVDMEPYYRDHYYAQYDLWRSYYVETEPSGTAEGLAAPQNPGSSLCAYDPDRELYISGENVYLDYYVNVSVHAAFKLYVLSKQPLEAEDISVTFPVDLPFLVNVVSEDVQRSTTGKVSSSENAIQQRNYLPYYVYQAYKGVEFSTREDLSLYPEFEALRQDSLPEFYVYVINIAMHEITEIQETVVLESLDITIGNQTHTVRLGGVRILPESEFPAHGEVAGRMANSGKYYQLYNEGIVRLPDAIRLERLKQDITLTGLYMVDEQTEILDIAVRLISDGNELEMKWDGKMPLYLYAGDSVYVDLIVRDLRTAELCSSVLFQICAQYTDAAGQQLCAVMNKADLSMVNYHELYAIIFDGVDMEPYYSNHYYPRYCAWRDDYLEMNP